MDFLSLNSGKSVEGLEIEAFRTNFKDKKYLYLMAGVHGDEVEGIYVLKQLFNWLKEMGKDSNKTIYNIPTIVIPILNKDGFRQGTRVNAQGVDLNRNLPSKEWSNVALEAKYHPGNSPLSEPENIFLANLFKKFPPKLIISFHSWKPLINYNGQCQDIAKFIQKYNKYPIFADLEDHPTPGSLGEFAPEEYNCPVLTFECPVLSKKDTLESIWEENEKAFKNLLLDEVLTTLF